MKTPQRFASAVWTVLLLSFAACADDWPQWRGPNRDGKSAETGLLKSWPSGGPKLIWKVTGLGEGFSGPSIADGKIFVTGHIGNDLVLRSLDLNGRGLWRATHGPGWRKTHAGSRGTPTVDGRNVYLFSGMGLLVCYQAASGGRLWSVDVTKRFRGRPHTWGYAESVLIHGNLAIVSPGGPNCIVALDKNTGRTVWTSKGLNDRAHYSSCIAFKFEGASLIIPSPGVSPRPRTSPKPKSTVSPRRSSSSRPRSGVSSRRPTSPKPKNAASARRSSSSRKAPGRSPRRRP